MSMYEFAFAFWGVTGAAGVLVAVLGGLANEALARQARAPRTRTRYVVQSALADVAPISSVAQQRLA